MEAVADHLDIVVQFGSEHIPFAGPVALAEHTGIDWKLPCLPGSCFAWMVR